MFQSFEDLDVWKRACQLSVRIYELLQESREYSLRDQRQRAAVSIARGSAAELRTQCYIACKINVLTTEQLKSLVEELKAISKMLTGLAKAVKQRHTDSA